MSTLGLPTMTCWPLSPTFTPPFPNPISINGAGKHHITMDSDNCPSITDMCAALNERANQQAANLALLRSRKSAALQQLKQTAAISPGVVPSGPRKRGEGCEDENQGIVGAEDTPQGAILRVTLLAAGFLIGPGGASVRGISHKTGASIRSWSDSFCVQGRQRKVRTLVVEGPRDAVAGALTIISDAVERYKELCEGKYCGKPVDRSQFIRGVEFFYSPPPRSAVPYAAPLKPETVLGVASPGINSPASFASSKATAGHGLHSIDGRPPATHFPSGMAARSASASASASSSPSLLVASRHATPSSTSVQKENVFVQRTGVQLSSPDCGMEFGMRQPLFEVSLGGNSNANAQGGVKQSFEVVPHAHGQSLTITPDAVLDSAAALHSLSIGQAHGEDAEYMAGAMQHAAAMLGGTNFYVQPPHGVQQLPLTPMACHGVHRPLRKSPWAVAGSEDVDAALALLGGSFPGSQPPAPPRSAMESNAPEIQAESVLDGVDAGEGLPTPGKQYSLFGGASGNVLGTNLVQFPLNDNTQSLDTLCTPKVQNASVPSNWQGHDVIKATDDTLLSACGFPTFGAFAEKSPQFSEGSLFAGFDPHAPLKSHEYLKHGSFQPLQFTQDGCLRSAFEEAADDKM